MENTALRSMIKFVLVVVILLVLSSTAFITGFSAAAYLAHRSAARVPTATPIVPIEPTGPPTPTPVTVPEPSDEAEKVFQLFWEVWGHLEEDFYGELPDLQTVTYGAIRGMLETLDDEYTSFIEPRIAEIEREDAGGSFEGIGALVRMREDGKLEIVHPFEGQPAQEAGLRAGDLVLAVDGESIIGYGIYEAIALIRGPAGTEVTLTVERPGQVGTFEVTIVRARIEIPIVEARMLEDDIAYIRLFELSMQATGQMEGSLEELLAEEPVALIFDLRNNPGGFLDEAVDVTDLFLDDGLVLIERFSDGREHEYTSRDGDLAEEIPLLVLVNGGTASGAEIVAGAIQDCERGILIGEPTFGKGSVQRIHTLSDGSELRVTTALWFLPSGWALEGEGLTPDIEVAWPEDTAAGEDPQLERAIEYVLTGE